MSSFNRISLALRSSLAETSLFTYLVTTLIGLGCLAITAYSLYDRSYPDELIIIPPDPIFALLSSVAFFPALIISANFFSKRFKNKGRAGDYLVLPLSNQERFGFSLIYSWIIVPLITYLPIFLLCLLTILGGHDYFVGPTPLHLLKVLLLSLSLYYVLSIFWLFPAIAFPKLGVVIVLGLIGISVAATFLVHGILPDSRMGYSVDSSVFKDPNVVGMADVAAYDEVEPRSEIDFGNQSSDNGMNYIPMLIACPLLLFAAYRALTRQQA